MAVDEPKKGLFALLTERWLQGLSSRTDRSSIAVVVVGEDRIRDALDSADSLTLRPAEVGASISQVDTPLWDSLQKAVNKPFPTARIRPSLSVGFTDARVHRDLGAVAYGAGLMSPSITAGDFSTRFHGNDERIDVESLDLTTNLWLDTITDLLG